MKTYKRMVPYMTSLNLYPLNEKFPAINTIFAYDSETNGKGGTDSFQLNAYHYDTNIYKEIFLEDDLFYQFMRFVYDNMRSQEKALMFCHYLEYDLEELVTKIPDVDIGHLLNFNNFEVVYQNPKTEKYDLLNFFSIIESHAYGEIEVRNFSEKLVQNLFNVSLNKFLDDYSRYLQEKNTEVQEKFLADIKKKGKYIEDEIMFCPRFSLSDVTNANRKLYMIDTMLLFRMGLAKTTKYLSDSKLYKIFKKKFNIESKLDYPAFLGRRSPRKDRDHVYTWKGKIDDTCKDVDVFDPEKMNELDMPEYEYFKEYAMTDIRVTLLLGDIIRDILRVNEITPDYLVSSASLTAKIFRNLYMEDAVMRDNHPQLVGYEAGDYKVSKDNLGNMTTDVPEKDLLLAYSYPTYYGARNEVYAVGEFDNVKVFDINSSYGLAQTMPLPFDNKPWTYVKKLEEDDNLFGYYKVKVAIDQDEFMPLVPLKLEFDKRDNRLFFPTGIFDTYINHRELLFALKNNNMEVLKCQGWVRGMTERDLRHPLRDFTLDNFEMRVKAQKAGDILNDLYNKMKIVSGYGKLCQTNEFHENAYTGEFEVLKLYKSGSMFLPRIASHITSYAREFIEEVLIDPSSNPLRCHTDSNYNIGDIDEKYVGNGLGKLKVEAYGKAVILRSGVCGLRGKIWDKEERKFIDGYKISKHSFWGKDKELMDFLFEGKTSQLKYKVMKLQKLRGAQRGVLNAPLHARLIDASPRMFDTKPDIKRKREKLWRRMDKIRSCPVKTYPFEINQLLIKNNPRDFYDI